MTMLFLAPHLKGDSWLKHIRREGPDIELRVWPDAGRVEDVVLALCWKHPSGELKNYPNLKCIASLGFGVDHVLRDPDLPAGVPVTRIVDAGMVAAMRSTFWRPCSCIRGSSTFTTGTRRKKNGRRALRSSRTMSGWGSWAWGISGPMQPPSCVPWDLRFAAGAAPPASWRACGALRGLGVSVVSRTNRHIDLLLPLTPATEGILTEEHFRSFRRAPTLSMPPAGIIWSRRTSWPALKAASCPGPVWMSSGQNRCPNLTPSGATRG